MLKTHNRNTLVRTVLCSVVPLPCTVPSAPVWGVKPSQTVREPVPRGEGGLATQPGFRLRGVPCSVHAAEFPLERILVVISGLTRMTRHLPGTRSLVSRHTRVLPTCLSPERMLKRFQFKREVRSWEHQNFRGGCRTQPGRLAPASPRATAPTPRPRRWLGHPEPRSMTSGLLAPPLEDHGKRVILENEN